MTFGANARGTHSSTYSKWPLKRTLFPHYVYPEPDSRREGRRRSIATAWHVRDVISRPAPGIRIVLAITEGSEVEFWILARPFGTRVTRRVEGRGWRGGRRYESWRTTKGREGRKVREARLRRVSSEFRLRPLVYEISDISRRPSEISNGTEHLPRDPPASLSTRLKYVRHERGCNTRHFACLTIALKTQVSYTQMDLHHNRSLIYI